MIDVGKRKGEDESREGSLCLQQSCIVLFNLIIRNGRILCRRVLN